MQISCWEIFAPDIVVGWLIGAAQLVVSGFILNVRGATQSQLRSAVDPDSRTREIFFGASHTSTSADIDQNGLSCVRFVGGNDDQAKLSETQAQLLTFMFGFITMATNEL